MNKNNFPLLKAFTLVELLISVTIFTFFIALGVASYIHVSVALKKADVERKLYGEMENIMNDIQNIGKFHHIDYEWYISHHIPIDPEHGNNQLVLLSADGSSRTLLSQEEGGTILGMYKEKKENGVFVPLPGFTALTLIPIHSRELKIQNARFFLFPATAEDALSFQEKVTVSLTGNMKSPLDVKEKILTLQSTFSSRLYAPML